jgi:hypothetical protein
MSKKIIYVHPGDMLEIRYVHQDYEKTARDWNFQIYPSSTLLMSTGHGLASADPAFRLDQWPDAKAIEMSKGATP